jgi:hypothetical protein
LEEGKTIYENLTGSKELVIFEGAGHTALYGAAPGQWKAAVERFLTKIAKGVP